MRTCLKLKCCREFAKFVVLLLNIEFCFSLMVFVLFCFVVVRPILLDSNKVSIERDFNLTNELNLAKTNPT